MQESKKSKKETIEKLRMILDNPSVKDPTIDNKSYLNSLQKRLIKPSKQSLNYKNEGSPEWDNSLKASITIHRREESSYISPEPKYIEFHKREVKEQKENLFENEELYEVEKVEIDIPEFVEVKPKNVVKTEEDIPIWETTTEMENKEIHKIDNELPEWELVEPEKVKINKELEEGKSKIVEKIPEWEPISIEDIEEELPVTEKLEEKKEILQESTIKNGKQIDAFEDITSIDEKTAVLLYNNGYNSIDDLIEANIKDLTEIKGIKRRLAKKIKKDIKKNAAEKIMPKNEPLEIKEEASKKPTESTFPKKNYPVVETGKVKDAVTNKATQREEKVYRHGEYSLYRKEIKLGSDKKRTIHFFSKEKPDDGKPVQLPYGYEIKINRKTGVPYVRKKK